ncbi:hypothetical protein FS749_010302 [Ceratobasidium sp. UAMH 11750]|nr:hypothetical protein FS749_010302 [Ceratobasidium sp. UAMH 11750]
MADFFCPVVPTSYYTSGTSANYDGQRLHVLKGNSSNIWDSTWSYAGKLTVPNRDDVWSIDATVLRHSTGKYLVYSSFDGDDQCLWIAKMNSPTSLGNAYKISTPTNSWERIGAAVNEGPAGLYHGGRTWIVYSASSCSGSGYSLASLELTGSNPLSAASWTKNNTGPIFSGANDNAATGHNGFFTAPSGNIYNVYHASPPTAVGCGSNRRTMVQAVNWFANVAPNLRQPRPLSEEIPEPM